MTAAGRGAVPDRVDPLGSREFESLIERLGPFEPRPRLAVAVSGGPDSMALLLLADEWARRRGGDVVALTVDHRLRPESATEAVQVGAWCAARGIDHAVLACERNIPQSRLQERAREMRYALLADVCRRRRVVYLLTGHQMDDQAETFLFRMGRGSGVAGLAGVPAAATMAGVRVLRPLLGVRRARLAATCAALGQPVIDDPSNRDRRFARVVLRERIAELEYLGIGVPAMARAAAAMAAARAGAERAVSDLAAASMSLFPEGFAEIDAVPVADAPADTAVSLFGGLLPTIGGSGRAPKRARLEALVSGIRQPACRPRTLGGCVIRRDGTRIRVYREHRRIVHRLQISGRADVLWDGRFRVTSPHGPAQPPVELCALGEHGWQEIASQVTGKAGGVPGPVRFGLPALRRGGSVISVPHLGFRRVGEAGEPVFDVRFAPRNTLCGAPFWVV